MIIQSSATRRARPSVTVSGSYSTISGTGFGTKPASTIYYDDFESYSTGQVSEPLGSTVYHSVGNGQPVPGSTITTSDKYSGTKSYHHVFGEAYGGSSFPHPYYELPGTNKKCYLACKYKFTGITGSPNGVWKFSRIGASTVYSGSPHAGESYVGTNSNKPLSEAAVLQTGGSCTKYGDDGEITNGESVITPDVWHLYEAESFTGDIDTANCFFEYRWSMQPALRWSNRVFLCGDGNALPTWILYPNNAVQTPGTVESWLDELYIDDGSRARVVMTDNATYSSSTKWAHQIPTAWSDTQITITTKRGAFAVNDTAYLHVFNDNGTLVHSSSAITVVEDA